MNKKTKVLLFALVSLFLSVLVGLLTVRYIYFQFFDNLVDQYAQQELAEAKQTAAFIEDQVRITEDSLKLIAQLPEIQGDDVELCNEKIAEIIAMNPRISNLGRVGTDKKFICSFNKDLVNTDAERLGPYITEIFADPNHKPVMSRIIKVPNAGHAVAIHVPVFNEQREFVGTLGGAFYFDQFADKFLEDRVSTDKHLVVLQDDDGTILYHPSSEQIGKNIMPKTEEETINSSDISRMIIQSAKDGSSGTDRYISSLDQREYVGAFTPAEVFSERRWIVVVTIPIEEVQSRAFSQRTRSTFIFILFFSVSAIIIPSLLLLWFLIRSVFKPLAEMERIVTKIGEGDLTLRVPTTNNKSDEINRLAIVFNDMVSKLQEFNSTLSEQVAQKTKQLTEKVLELQQSKDEALQLLTEINEAKVKDEALLSSIGDGVVATDAVGKITFVNATSESILGYKSSELLGQVLAQAIQYSDGNGVPLLESERLMTKALQTGKKVSGRGYYRRKDGTNIPVAITVSPIILEENVIGTIEIFRDITPEIQLEKMKNEFVSIASHELRTPMTAIKGLVSMILDGDYGEVNKGLQQPLKDIFLSTERLIHLVSDMLSLSRIEAGRLKFDITQFDIASVVSETVSVLQPIAKEKNLTLTAPDIPEVLVESDRDKLSQVLNNLIGNALKFTPAGSITITTSVAADRVNVYVTDTGSGIPKDEEAKLFGKFQQLGSFGSRPVGTGLGLYISRELVRKMGGDMWLEKSEVGKGSTFAFSVPIAESDSAKKAKYRIESEAQAHPDQVSN